jgi:hypothetical protein
MVNGIIIHRPWNECCNDRLRTVVHATPFEAAKHSSLLFKKITVFLKPVVAC